MIEGGDDLAPERQTILGRIQVVAVVALIGIVVAINVVDRAFDIATWKVLAVGFGLMIALAFAATVATSRVEGKPLGQVAGASARSVVHDIKNVPRQMRQRFNDTLGRPR